MIGKYFGGSSNFPPIHRTNRVRGGDCWFFWLSRCVFRVSEVVMNIRNLGLPLAVAALLALAGCSTATVVTLQNGTQYLTRDTPKANSEEGVYAFEDIAGTKVKVKADEVATVRKED